MKDIIKQLKAWGVKYELQNVPHKPIKVIYKPINKSDDWYDKFDDFIHLYNLKGVVKTNLKENNMKLRQLRQIIREEIQKEESKGSKEFDLFKPGQTVTLDKDESFDVKGGKYKVVRVYYQDDEVAYEVQQGGESLDLTMNYVHGVGDYWKKGIAK